MKRIFLAVALLCGVYTAQAWNFVYDQATLLLAYENMTPAAQTELKRYLGEDVDQQIKYFEKARKKGELLESEKWGTISLDLDLNPIIKDDKNAISQLENAVEVVKNRSTKSAEEVTLAIRKIIELTIEMHNVGNITLEEFTNSSEDFTFSQSMGGYGDREKFRDRKWRHFWSYGFSVFHSSWSAEMHVRDLKVCHGRYKEQYMKGSISEWATDMGKVVTPLYKLDVEGCYFTTGNDGWMLSRQGHAEAEEVFLAGVARAAYRIAALMNAAVQ